MSDRRSRRSNVLGCIFSAKSVSPSSVFRYQFTLKLNMITPADGGDVEYLLLSTEQTWLGYAACGLILGRRQAPFRIACLPLRRGRDFRHRLWTLFRGGMLPATYTFIRDLGRALSEEGVPLRLPLGPNHTHRNRPSFPLLEFQTRFLR
jgi:hypothetical protein